MNQTFRSGAALHRLIEDAPHRLLPQFLDEEIVEEIRDEDELRSMLQNRLADTDPLRLKQLEDSAGRIRTLADAGAWALGRVAEDRLHADDLGTFRQQLDQLGRSLWCFCNTPRVFDDAESLHNASRYRGNGKLYAAFDVAEPVDLEWSEDLRDRLVARIVEQLDLQGSCSISHICLRQDKRDEHVLIVRHAGPLASVPEFLSDGRRGRHYYTPPDEATLIYTPENGMVEICAAQAGVRQKIGTCFAVTGLGQDPSSKPITYKLYDLSRFSTSLGLPQVEPERFSVEPPRVVEVDLRPHHPRRKISLKVAAEDDIEHVADDLLGPGFFRRSGEIVRVVISVRYRGPSDPRSKTLSICVSHPNTCNLRSFEEPSQRELAVALLKAWGVLRTFEAPSAAERRAVLPSLLELYALPSDVVLETDLRSRHLDVEELALRAFIALHGRHTRIEQEDDGPLEVDVDLAGDPSQVAWRDADGRSATMPASLVQQYKIDRDWVEESIGDELKPCFSSWSVARIDETLAFLGELDLASGSVPCYLARRLEDRKVFERLDVRLRAENDGRRGIVLDAGRSGLSFLAAHVVLAAQDCLSTEEGRALDLDAISVAFDRLRLLAGKAGSVDLVQHSETTATLTVPGREPLSLVTKRQVDLFKCLVDGHRRGTPSVPTKDLMAGSTSRSPQNAFTPERWAAINGVYMEKVGKRSGWRLIVFQEAHSGQI